MSAGLTSADPAILEPTPETAPFWAALAEGRVVARRCSSCATLHPTPRHVCPRCGATDGTWEELPDEARLYSVTVVSHPPPGRSDLPSPYAIGLVDFPSTGHRMLALIDAPGGRAPPIGDRLSLHPVRSGGTVLPGFRSRAARSEPLSEDT